MSQSHAYQGDSFPQPPNLSNIQESQWQKLPPLATSVGWWVWQTHGFAWRVWGGYGSGYRWSYPYPNHHSWVWVRNLFSQSKMVNIVIILNIIDTHTTTQDNPYPSLRVWVCMGMGKGRGENTHGLPMSHTNEACWLRHLYNGLGSHKNYQPSSEGTTMGL